MRNNEFVADAGRRSQVTCNRELVVTKQNSHPRFLHPRKDAMTPISTLHAHRLIIQIQLITVA